MSCNQWGLVQLQSVVLGCTSKLFSMVSDRNDKTQRNSMQLVKTGKLAKNWPSTPKLRVASVPKSPPTSLRQLDLLTRTNSV